VSVAVVCPYQRPEHQLSVRHALVRRSEEGAEDWRLGWGISGKLIYHDGLTLG
jgi:hypothetical protein